MKEEILHYQWKYGLLGKTSLISHKGEPIKIINPGEQNLNSGPDFFNAKIIIGETTWAGNIEIHKKSSDWYTHNHHTNDAYNNVVLHVVLENDRETITNNGNCPAILVAQLNKEIEKQLENLIKSNDKIPCSKAITELDSFWLTCQFPAMAIKRMERKALQVEIIYEKTNHNWEQSLFILLANNFGFKLNADPFDRLARLIPFPVLLKCSQNQLQTEALLFGTAGFLQNVKDGEYEKKLQTEFKYLSQKFQLQSMDPHVWKFSRTRPANFPTTRIAQLAALLHNNSSLFSKTISIEKIDELIALFQVPLSDYWQHHYLLNDEKKQRKTGSIGIATIELILINTIVPLFFAYAKTKNQPAFSARALEILEALPAEKNSIIQLWNNINIAPQNALESQALIEIQTNYCAAKKCLDCNIGSKTLNNQVYGQHT